MSFMYQKFSLYFNSTLYTYLWTNLWLGFFFWSYDLQSLDTCFDLFFPTIEQNIKAIHLVFCGLC